MTEPKYPLSPSLTFEVAADEWMTRHASSIGHRTARTYSNHVKTLSRFFEGVPLSDIDIEKIREYRQWRSRKSLSGRS